jgi:hypothetical protein
MQKQPKFPLIATAATRAVLESPIFPQVLEHWAEVANRVIVVIPQGAQAPAVRKVRFMQVSRNIPSLGDVVTEVNKGMDYVVNNAAIVDPFTVFKWDAFQIFEIGKRRQLSLSWVATAHPVRLIDFDTPTGVDETQLSFFCGAESIWAFLNNREPPEHVPFVSPAWSGWLAHWCSQHVHTHKYHDVTDLKAIGLLEDIPVEEVSLEGIGKLTFNPPMRNYVTKGSRVSL